MQASSIYRYNQKASLRHVELPVTNEDEALYVEGTPDFYVRTTHPFHPKIVYLLIGESESQSSDYPDTQLAITTLGHLLDPIRNETAATLFIKSPLSATLQWLHTKIVLCLYSDLGRWCFQLFVEQTTQSCGVTGTGRWLNSGLSRSIACERRLPARFLPLYDPISCSASSSRRCCPQ